jgi:hypothetical protein
MKPIRVGFTTVLNEEMCIRGWIKTVSFFCEEVYVLIDPKTEDKTIDIILEEFPKVKILYQADFNLGPELANWHANQNNFIDLNIKDNEWFMFFDADERIEPKDFQEIYDIVENSINDPKLTMISMNRKFEFYPDEEHVIAFNADDLKQSIFFKKTPTLKRGLDPHNSFRQDHADIIYIDKSFYHYSRLKNKKNPFKWYDYIASSDIVRMRNHFGGIGVANQKNPIPNWQNLEDVPYER